MRFEFATAQRIIFGRGVLSEVMTLIEGRGQRPMIVTGRDGSRSQSLLDLIRSRGYQSISHSIAEEPSIEAIRTAALRARTENIDFIIAFGGGSVLDAGKAIAALAANEGDPLDYFEVIGQGRALIQRPLPCIAIPTTAGTGSEVTRNAVLTSLEHGLKVSLRHEWMLPAVALIDPELTLSVPPPITASTGLDALTQLIEPYLSIKANPMTDALCLEGIRRAVRSLQRAWECGDDLDAREDMALASLLGGMALANAGLGAVHGLAAPLGGAAPVPHGVACAALLPLVLGANLKSMHAGDSALIKFKTLAGLLTGDPFAEPKDGVRWTKALVEKLQIPRLREFGLKEADLEAIAEKGMAASSMKANPVKLDRETLIRLLRMAL
jgi:alcohol dehydrogenase class IV